MEYDRFMKGPGFFMKRSRNRVFIAPWNEVICSLIRQNRVTIMRPATVFDYPNPLGGLLTNATPKLRKMFRKEWATERDLEPRRVS